MTTQLIIYYIVLGASQSMESSNSTLSGVTSSHTKYIIIQKICPNFVWLLVTAIDNQSLHRTPYHPQVCSILIKCSIGFRPKAQRKLGMLLGLFYGFAPKPREMSFLQFLTLNKSCFEENKENSQNLLTITQYIFNVTILQQE